MATVPPLNLRSSQDDPLSAAQHDENMRTLRDAVNGLSALLSVAIRADGSLNDGAINRTAIFADRIVSRESLHWLANHYGTATLVPGEGGQYVVDFAPNPTESADPCAEVQDLSFPSPPGDGATTSFVSPIKFATGNTATPVTINVNGTGAKTLKKNVNEDLDEGEIESGAIHWIAWDGVNYQIISQLPLRFVKQEDSWQPAPTVGGQGVSMTHTQGVPPDSYSVEMKLKEGETDSGYTDATTLDALNSVYGYWADGYQHQVLFTQMTSANITVKMIDGAATYGVPSPSGQDKQATVLSKWEMRIVATWVK